MIIQNPDGSFSCYPLPPAAQLWLKQAVQRVYISALAPFTRGARKPCIQAVTCAEVCSSATT
jgi:hypothetical protein